jgi:murein DD-endopeptidase MepM/ murein hydrolase activator NlpD
VALAKKRGAALTGDHFTVLIFSRNSSNVRRYKIPKPIFWGLVLAFPPLIVLAVILGLNFFHNHNHANLIVELQERNANLQKEIRFFSESVVGLQNRIAQMKEFDSKLRVIANLENLPSPFFGVGGPLAEDLRERIRSQQGSDAFAMPMQPTSVPLVRESSATEKDPRDLKDSAHRTKGQVPHVPSIWPTLGWIIGDFGCRISPGSGHLEMHEGIEIFNSLGTPIVAPADGIVTTVGTDPHHGKMVVLSHGHGVVTRFGHLGDVDVKPGQEVEKGQRIGKMGDTGRSIGPHLYYEVKIDGIPTDPRKYLYN